MLRDAEVMSPISHVKVEKIHYWNLDLHHSTAHARFHSVTLSHRRIFVKLNLNMFNEFAKLKVNAASQDECFSF